MKKKKGEKGGGTGGRKGQVDNKYSHARALWKRGYHRQNAIDAGFKEGWDKTKCPVLFGDLTGVSADDLLPIMRRVLDAAQEFAGTKEYYPYMACVQNQVATQICSRDFARAYADAPLGEMRPTNMKPHTSASLDLYQGGRRALCEGTQLFIKILVEGGIFGIVDMQAVNDGNVAAKKALDAAYALCTKLQGSNTHSRLAGDGQRGKVRAFNINCRRGGQEGSGQGAAKPADAGGAGDEAHAAAGGEEEADGYDADGEDAYLTDAEGETSDEETGGGGETKGESDGEDAAGDEDGAGGVAGIGAGASGDASEGASGGAGAGGAGAAAGVVAAHHRVMRELHSWHQDHTLRDGQQLTLIASLCDGAAGCLQWSELDLGALFKEQGNGPMDGTTDTAAHLARNFTGKNHWELGDTVEGLNSNLSGFTSDTNENGAHTLVRPPPK
jgi:hypothetical protein